MSDLTPVIPRFDEDKCTPCSICETVCPYGAISRDQNAGSVPKVTRELCFGCGWCVGHCPKNAIDVGLAETGEMVWNGYGTIKDWVK